MEKIRLRFRREYMGKYRPNFTIDGIPVPIPDDYGMKIADLSSEDSGRTLDGIAHKDVIAVKATTPWKWGKLEWNTAAAICNAVDGKESVVVQIMDVRKPYQMTQKTIYIGDRDTAPVKFDEDGKVYWSVSFDEIEV